MKGYLRRLGELRKEGKANDDIQAEYEKQKKEIRKRLNEQFPDVPEIFFDDEPHPEPEQTKPDIDNVFNHVH